MRWRSATGHHGRRTGSRAEHASSVGAARDSARLPPPTCQARAALPWWASLCAAAAGRMRATVMRSTGGCAQLGAPLTHSALLQLYRRCLPPLVTSCARCHTPLSLPSSPPSNPPTPPPPPPQPFASVTAATARPGEPRADALTRYAHCGRSARLSGWFKAAAQEGCRFSLDCLQAEATRSGRLR